MHIKSVSIISNLICRLVNAQHYVGTLPKIGTALRQLFTPNNEFIIDSLTFRLPWRLLAGGRSRTVQYVVAYFENEYNGTNSFDYNFVRPKLWQTTADHVNR